MVRRLNLSTLFDMYICIYKAQQKSTYLRKNQQIQKISKQNMQKNTTSPTRSNKHEDTMEQGKPRFRTLLIFSTKMTLGYRKKAESRASKTQFELMKSTYSNYLS